jgi:tetratricopeptide (TPR) repeat protein
MKLRAGILGPIVAVALSGSSFASADPGASPTARAATNTATPATTATQAATTAAAAAQAPVATSPAPTRADALFTAAKQLRAAGLYEDACPKFAETEKLEPGIGVTLYLADCYQHTGRSANAWAEFRKAELLARDRNDKRADIAKARADALEVKLTRMTLAVADAAKHPGLEIAVDGTQIRSENWNSVLPTDPGSHAVEIEEPGQLARTLNVHLDEGTILTVPVFEAAAAAAPAVEPAPIPASAPTEATADSAPPKMSRTRAYVGYALLGVGVIGVTAGVGYLDAKNNAISKDKRSSAGTFAGVSFAVGAAGFASAIVLYLTAPKDPSTALTLSPTVGASGAGALLQGSF